MNAGRAEFPNRDRWIQALFALTTLLQVVEHLRVTGSYGERDMEFDPNDAVAVYLAKLAWEQTRMWCYAAEHLIQRRIMNQSTGGAMTESSTFETPAFTQERAKAALFGAFAGAAWICWSNAFVGEAVVYWGPATTVFVLGVLVWSVCSVRRIRSRKSHSAVSRFAIINKWKFWVIAILEFLVAGCAVYFLIASRHPQLIPIAVALVVGLHFLPLAKVLKMPHLYTTGIYMIFIAVLSSAIPRANIRNVILCVGIGFRCGQECSL